VAEVVDSELHFVPVFANLRGLCHNPGVTNKDIKTPVGKLLEASLDRCEIGKVELHEGDIRSGDCLFDFGNAEIDMRRILLRENFNRTSTKTSGA
jgi:hypothetical protein